MNNPSVLAALIAAGVSLLGVAASLLIARWQIRSKLNELEWQAQSKLSELEQTQLADVLEERMKAYAKLWSVIQTNVTHWQIEKKERDTKWANDFLTALNACFAEYGVFFSEDVYVSFFNFRQILITVVDKLAQNPGSFSEPDFDSLVRAWSGKSGQPGLATQLKADLGSYRPTIFRLTP